ncbi:hypothetical protein PG989_011002 [Apiospora arundinis]
MCSPGRRRSCRCSSPGCPRRARRRSRPFASHWKHQRDFSAKVVRTAPNLLHQVRIFFRAVLGMPTDEALSSGLGLDPFYFFRDCVKGVLQIFVDRHGAGVDLSDHLLDAAIDGVVLGIELLGPFEVFGIAVKRAQHRPPQQRHFNVLKIDLQARQRGVVHLGAHVQHMSGALGGVTGFLKIPLHRVPPLLDDVVEQVPARAQLGRLAPFVGAFTDEDGALAVFGQVAELDKDAVGHDPIVLHAPQRVGVVDIKLNAGMG